MASNIKRARRTKAQMEEFKEAIYRVLSDYNPMTVRQVFYQLVAHRVIEKAERMYDSVQQNLVKMRKDKIIPFSWISDNTRWIRKPDTYSSMQQMLRYSVQTYRRALWNEQGVYVEVWCEKDALAGLIIEETDPFDVPLMVSRGFSSITYLHEAAENIADKGKPAYIYYFGDHDPSGKLIPEVLERNLREYAPGAEIHFTQIAITEDQIKQYNLPTRPTKKGSHKKDFVGESVELDALPASVLRGLVRRCITQHIDPDIYNRTLETERMERETLKRIEAGWERLIA